MASMQATKREKEKQDTRESEVAAPSKRSDPDFEVLNQSRSQFADESAKTGSRSLEGPQQEGAVDKQRVPTGAAAGRGTPVYDSARSVLYDSTGEAIRSDPPRDDPRSGLVTEHVPVEEAIREAELSGRRLPEPGPWQEVGPAGQAAKDEAEQQSSGQEEWA